MGLRWAIDEMEKRYKLFAKVGVRNIKTFNSRVRAVQPDLFDESEEPAAAGPAVPDRLPYIVIVIDELADLMMVAQSDVENAIARLAQLSRAVGIHMVIATQRPSVNVITGTIKANFPARIAFQVAQKVDSRTILDANGADQLLGKGDMLFVPPGTSRLVRAQGALTTDDEITRVVEFIKAQGKPDYEIAVQEKIESKLPETPESDEDSELLEAAVEIIRQTRRASTSSLQRRLRIGYNRAARLMDELENRGVIGPPKGSDPRDILIDLDGDIPQNESDYEAPRRRRRGAGFGTDAGPAGRGQRAPGGVIHAHARRNAAPGARGQGHQRRGVVAVHQDHDPPDRGDGARRLPFHPGPDLRHILYQGPGPATRCGRGPAAAPVRGAGEPRAQRPP